MGGSTRSISKGSSKQFMKTSIDLAASSRSVVQPDIVGASISAIRHEESNDLAIVYAAREDLLERVFVECARRDFDAAAARYVAACACEAVRKIVAVQFFAHDFGRDDFAGSEAWAADGAPACSPPDTWAALNVPVVEAGGDDEPTSTAAGTPSTTTPASAGADRSESSKGGTADSADASTPMSMSSFVEQYLVAPQASEVELEEYPDDDVEIQVRKEQSLFTTLMTCSTESSPFSRYSMSLKWRDSIQQKIQGKTSTKSLQLEKKSSKTPGDSKININTLPPLRAEAQLRIMGSCGKDEAKKDEKDNKKEGSARRRAD